MSYEIMNIHIGHGCPAGDDAGIWEVAEWVGEYVHELEAELTRLREIERLYNEAMEQEPVGEVKESGHFDGGLSR